MHHDFYSLFSAYWWLLFPLGWAIFRLIRLFLDHKRAGQALVVIQTYTSQGKEIPPDLLQLLQQPTTVFNPWPFNRTAREKARGLLIPGFLFVALAVAFMVLIIGRIAGGDREAYVGMTFVVVLFLGFAAAFFITSYLYHQDAKRLDPALSEKEKAWVLGAQAGSAEDFAQLLRLHQQALRAFLRRLSRNAADADDLAQETFVFAWEHIGRFDASRTFRPWLFGIAWRKYRQRSRGLMRLLRREQAVEQETVIVPDPALKLDMVKALEGLPPEQRAVILLCLMEQMTHEEAAAALALPLGTVKSHIARGREKLAVALGGIDV